MKCPASSQASCRVQMSRAFTPFIYYMSPAALYPGQEVAFWVDPRSTQNIKAADDLPFDEARINGFTIDFEGYVDATTYLSAYARNQVRGKLGDQVNPNSSASVVMKFASGYTLTYDSTALRCNYQNTSCYRAKVMPAITYIDSISGYVTGGQLLTIQGWGFDSEKNLEVQVDD